MQRVQSVKLNIKLDRFKTFITASIGFALSFVPSAAFFYIGSSYAAYDITRKNYMFIAALTFMFTVVSQLVMKLCHGPRDNAFLKFMSGAFFDDLLDKMTAKKFKTQNDNDIIILREGQRYSSMNDDNKDRFYLLCAQIEQENFLYASMYEKWSTAIYEKLVDDKKIMQEMVISSCVGGHSFGWNNLISLLGDIKSQPWFESDRFKSQLNFVRGQAQKEKFDQSQNANFFAYVESFTKINVLDKAKNADCQMYTNSMMIEPEYKLKDTDYTEISKALTLYGVLAFDKIYSLLENMDYPRVDWQKYKSVVQSVYFSNDENYKKFISLANKKILTQIAISGIYGANNNEYDSVSNLKDLPLHTFSMMPHSVLLDYQSSFNLELWSELKRKCNLIYDNQAIAGEATVRELNVKLATALPLLMASDTGMKRTGLGSQSTKDLLRDNMLMMVQEVDLLVGDLEKKLSMGVAAGNKYMKMRA